MKRLLRLIMVAAALAAPSFACAQSPLLQGGQTVRGHVPVYNQSGTAQPIVIDSGPAGGNTTGQGLSELNVTARGTGTAPFAAQGTGPYGTINCTQDAVATNSTGYHYLCLSANAQGGGLIAYGAAGGATDLPLQLIVNGSTFTLPGSASCIGCGTMAGQNANAVAITGGTISGVTMTGTTITSSTLNGINYPAAPFVIGDILYATSTTAMGRLADVAVGSLMVSGGVAGAPAWSAAPFITTSLTVPTLYGGSGTASNLTIKATSSTGAVSDDRILMKSTGFSSGQFLVDLIDINQTTGGGPAMRYFALDSLGVVQLNAVINGGMSDNTAGAFKGDIDMVVYGPGAAVQACVALNGGFTGFVPCADNTYQLGDATLRWSAVNTNNANVGTFVNVGGASNLISNRGLQVVASVTGNLIGLFQNTHGSALDGGIGIAAGSSSTTDSTTTMIAFYQSTFATVAGSITRSGTSTVAYNTSSDLRLKENITPATRGLDVLKKIEVRDFSWKSDAAKTRVNGLIAQQLAPLYPEAVHVGGADTETDPWQVDYGRLSPLIIRSVQELEARVRALESARR